MREKNDTIYRKKKLKHLDVQKNKKTSIKLHPRHPLITHKRKDIFKKTDQCKTNNNNTHKIYIFIKVLMDLEQSPEL